MRFLSHTATLYSYIAHKICIYPSLKKMFFSKSIHALFTQPKFQRVFLTKLWVIVQIVIIQWAAVSLSWWGSKHRQCRVKAVNKRTSLITLIVYSCNTNSLLCRNICVVINQKQFYSLLPFVFYLHLKPIIMIVKVNSPNCKHPPPPL